MSDEQFPVPKGQEDITDELVNPPAPPEITDEMVNTGAASETPAGFYEDQAKVRAAQEPEPENIEPAVFSKEDSVALTQARVNQAIELSDEFAELETELNRTDVSPQDKMAAIDSFMKGPAVTLAHDSGFFTGVEIKNLPVMKALAAESQRLFEVVEAQNREGRDRDRREGSRVILEEARDRVVSGDLKDASTEEKRKFLEGQFLSAIRNAPGLVDDIPGATEFRKLMSEMSEASAEERLSSEDERVTEVPQDEEIAPENETSDNQEQILSAPTDNEPEQKPGLFSRIKSSLGSLRSRISQRVERFIHGDSLSSINGIVSSAQLDRAPRTPDMPEREEEETPAEVPPADIQEAPAAEELSSVPASEAPVAEMPVEPATEDQDLDVQEGAGDEVDKNAVTQEMPRAATTAEEQGESPSAASVIESLANQVAIPSQEQQKEATSPESRAFDAAVDFTASIEGALKGLGALDYAKGYDSFANRMADLLVMPEGVSPENFKLTQDRIMYRIARDEDFPKQARELLVRLLEKRGAVKVEDRGDGKKVIRRLVSYGEAA